MKTYPSLAEYNENMKNLPKLKEYLATCEDKNLTFNNKSAKLNGTMGFWRFEHIILLAKINKNRVF